LEQIRRLILNVGLESSKKCERAFALVNFKTHDYHCAKFSIQNINKFKAMSSFSIPEQFESGFARLLSITEAELESITVLLNEVPVGMGPRSFKKLLRERIKIEDSVELTKVLFSFSALLFERDEEFSEIALQLANSFFSDKEDEIKESEIEENRKKLSARLLLIFNNCDNLVKSFKALHLLSENSTIYQSSRIISDIRLVFNDELDSVNRCGVIIHNLKLELFRNGNINEDIFISMDLNDLKSLRDHLTRAIEKDGLIRKDYMNSISFIETSE